MCLKISLVLTLVLYFCVTTTFSWEIAVTSGEEITFLFSNGTIQGGLENEDRRTSNIQFTELSALVFDNVKHRLFATDTKKSKGSSTTSGSSIYSINLARQNHTKLVIQPIVLHAEEHSVQGIAFDAISSTLFWTESHTRRIMHINVDDSGIHAGMPKQLFAFKDEIPQGIAVDSCSQSLFWTNCHHKHPGIEKSTLTGENREIIISEDLFTPVGICVDQMLRRIFWADDSEGIYYRIESANLDGSDRRIIVNDRHQQPFGIAVGVNNIFWTDWISNGIWSASKYGENENPVMIRKFPGETPMGITMKNYQFINKKECETISSVIKSYNESTTETYKSYNNSVSKNITKPNALPTTATRVKTPAIVCYNNGSRYVNVNGDQLCKCPPAFDGPTCEIPTCHNYCVHGKCSLTTNGYTECWCLPGYFGPRCEIDSCEGYCLNGGRCYLDKNNNNKFTEYQPLCECSEDYAGQRCEFRRDIDQLCNFFCENKEFIVAVRGKLFTNCVCYNDVTHSSTEKLTSSTSNELGILQNPLVIALLVLSFVLMVVSVVLVMAVCWLRRRPRIKKRIIVNKNVTPLTCRPLSSQEQCEITIENCCNMNICETPCFEPPQLRSGKSIKSDDKKTLLANMENEDIY